MASSLRSGFPIGIIAAIPLLFAGAAHAQTVKAFPTAEGFGAKALGGRAGRVIEVTNLNDSGTGSLRACAAATGARTCVFRVSGTITLSSNMSIAAGNSFLTIAGQTSPGGIQLKGGGIHVRDGGHDVILRHLRIRPGTVPSNPAIPVNPNDPSTYLLQDTNAFIAWGNNGVRVYNIIVDHCSLQWSTDQNGPDAWGYVTDYSAQWNITAEGTTVGNTKGPHNMGLIVGGSGSTNSTYSLHHSLLAHNAGRNPLISQSGVMDFRNNVVYNWSYNNASSWGNWLPSDADTPVDGFSAFGNIVNNHYIPGPMSSTLYIFTLNNLGPTRVDGTSASRGGTKVFTSGNWSPKCPAGCSDDALNGYYTYDYYNSQTYCPGTTTYCTPLAPQGRTVTPFTAPSVTTDPTSGVKTKVLATVGASKPKRDVVDSRIVNDVINLTGVSKANYLNPFAGGPWPDLSTGAPAAPADSDHDGMPDSWELSNGLNPSSASDGALTSGNGYTNLENYLNQLAGDPVPGIAPATPPAIPMNLSVL